MEEYKQCLINQFKELSVSKQHAKSLDPVKRKLLDLLDDDSDNGIEEECTP